MNRREILRKSKIVSTEKRNAKKTYLKEYYLRNKERAKQRVKDWQKQHPEKFSALRRRLASRHTRSLSDSYINRILARDGIEDSEAGPDLAAALRRLLEWVWMQDQGTTRSAQAAMVRFAAMTQIVCPDAIADMTYKEIGEMFGLTKAAIGKQAIEFRNEFGLETYHTRGQIGRENMSRKASEVHAARKERNKNPETVTA